MNQPLCWVMRYIFWFRKTFRDLRSCPHTLHPQGTQNLKNKGNIFNIQTKYFATLINKQILQMEKMKIILREQKKNIKTFSLIHIRIVSFPRNFFLGITCNSILWNEIRQHDTIMLNYSNLFKNHLILANSFYPLQSFFAFWLSSFCCFCSQHLLLAFSFVFPPSLPQTSADFPFAPNSSDVSVRGFVSASRLRPPTCPRSGSFWNIGDHLAWNWINIIFNIVEYFTAIDKKCT